MRKTPKSFADLPPIRVRKEPPTVTEAVTAAQDLSDDLEQQVEIAAGLIGMPAEEVRPHVLAAAETRQAARREAQGQRPHDRLNGRAQERILSPASPNRAPRTVVVVERRARPAVVVERRGGRPFEPRR